jgi:hypothetical protein
MPRPKGSKNKPKMEIESAQIPQDPDYDIEEIPNELEAGLNQEGLTLKTKRKILSRNVLPSEGLAINKDWIMKSDDLNIILMKRRSKTHAISKADTPDSWEYFHYGTIAGALQALLDKEVKSTKLKDIQTISDRIDKIEQDIKKTLGNFPVTH